MAPVPVDAISVGLEAAAGVPEPTVSLAQDVAAVATGIADDVAAVVADPAAVPEVLASEVLEYWPVWPYAGLTSGLLILGWATATRALRPPLAARLVPLALFMLHQFEAYGLDAYGRPYAMKALLCESSLFGGGGEAPDDCGVPDTLVAAAGLVGVYGNFVLPLWRRSERAATFSDGLVLVTAAAHVLGCVASGVQYNPGLATSLLLFVPYGVHFLGSTPASEAVLALATGVFQYAVTLAALTLRIDGVAPALLIQLGVAAAPLAVAALAPSEADDRLPPSQSRKGA